MPTLVLIVAGWVFVSLVSGVVLGTSIRRLCDRAAVVPPVRCTVTPAGIVVRTAVALRPTPRRR